MACRVEGLFCAERSPSGISSVGVHLTITREARCGVNLRGRHNFTRRVVKSAMERVRIATLLVEETAGEVEVVVPSRLQMRIVHRFRHGVARVADGEEFRDVGARG